MKKTPLKQGTLKWEKARATRIGSSEIFDIVKYYATDEELQNCGINAEMFRGEKPYSSAWALYHKMHNDGIYEKEELPPEFAEYGHAVEPYGLSILQNGRSKKLTPGAVYISDRLIASLDISGVSEEVDVKPFDFGNGIVPIGKKFVCEQKTMLPNVIKNGLPMKYVIQAQYQITMTGADFFILQIMVLKNDTAFERGKIVQMSKKKRLEYLRDKMSVTHFYFRNNQHLAALIKKCLERFFEAVDTFKEPTPFISCDTQKNIIESIRINTYYNKNLILDYDLSEIVKANDELKQAKEKRDQVLQEIIEVAKKCNASRFKSNAHTAAFSAAGAFLIKEVVQCKK